MLEFLRGVAPVAVAMLIAGCGDSFPRHATGPLADLVSDSLLVRAAGSCVRHVVRGATQFACRLHDSRDTVRMILLAEGRVLEYERRHVLASDDDYWFDSVHVALESTFGPAASGEDQDGGRRWTWKNDSVSVMLGPPPGPFVGFVARRPGGP